MGTRILIAICLFLMPIVQVCGTEPEILFLSAPRTGTHWALYCLCKILDRRVMFDRGPTEVELYEDLFAEHRTGWIYAAHNPKDLWIKKGGEHQDILVLIVRNYRESMIRNFGTVDNVLSEIRGEAVNCWLDDYKYIAFTQPHNHYFNNLRCYDFWDPAKRYLIYYEDLVQHPETVLRNVAAFFGCENENPALEELLANLEQHARLSIDLYETKWRSHSQGKDVLYHSLRIGRINCLKIDYEVRRHFTVLFDKYLFRYKTK